MECWSNAICERIRIVATFNLRIVNLRIEFCVFPLVQHSNTPALQRSSTPFPIEDDKLWITTKETVKRYNLSKRFDPCVYCVFINPD